MFTYGVYSFFPVFQYFLGGRRELYFGDSDQRKWYEKAYYDGFFLVIGLGGFLTGFLLGGVFLLLFWIPFALFVLPWLHPAWVCRFEKEHSRQEITYIKQRGQFFLEHYPRTFPQIVRNNEGWDMWVSAVI